MSTIAFWGHLYFIFMLWVPAIILFDSGNYSLIPKLNNEIFGVE